MSIFAGFERLITGAVDKYMGEPILIEPRLVGGYVKGPADVSRSTLTVIGLVDLNPVVLETKRKGKYDAYEPDLLGQRVHVSMDAAQFMARSLWPTKGDNLTAITMDGTPKWQVSAVEPDGLGRFVCICVPVA